ncbi:cytochrome P450 [Rhodocollybia butyracea]|uniref:Cytochrome P450 n=1 Tax=Rhodocollybia butyracea TaxID=206335 RepID=A0A9P5P7L5_9AGAR|nr:cytochrome P450 [Rhodocollybia butyracea]
MEPDLTTLYDWATLELSISVIFCLYVAVHAYNQWRFALPGPIALPFIGNIFLMPFHKPWLTFTSWNVKYGDIIHLHGLRQSIIVLNSKQTIDEFLEKRGNIYSHRPRYTVVGEMMGLDRGMPLLPYNYQWRLQRKLAKKALSSLEVKKYHTTQTQLAALMCHSFITDPLHFRDHVRLAAGRIIMSITYGIPVSDAQHEYITHAERTMEMISQATMPGAYMADIFPFLKHLPSWLPFTSFRAEAQRGRAMIEHLVEQPFANVVEGMLGGKACPSFTSDLLSGPEASTDAYRHAIKWAAGSMYGAGGESTYATILVFIVCMAQNISVQEKAQKELDQVIGSDRLPTIEDRERLPYVEVVIKEVLRWRPALPLGIPRRLDCEDSYAGSRITPNSIVIPNVWAIAMTVNQNYPASDFVPERFLEEHPPIDPSLYAFGFGRRICPGKLLAENSLFLLVASILYSCTISPPMSIGETGNKLNVKFTTGLVSYPLPFDCSIQPRSLERSDVIQRIATEGGFAI